MRRIAIISPFYNESKGLLPFLQSLDVVFTDSAHKVVFYMVDDGSTDDSAKIVREFAAGSLKNELHLLSMEFNTGHQSAIYEGLKNATQEKFDHYIILDSDGQDDISIIPSLLEKTNYDIVWVKRTSREDGFYFRFAYFFYQIIYRIISGRKIDFGNYSMISHKAARYLIINKYVHFPTALLTSPFSKSFIEAKRLARSYGKSKMATKDLVHHAFLSFVEDSEAVVNFFLKCTFFIGIIFILSIGNILYQKYIAHTAILGWTSITSIGLLNLVFLSFGLFAISLSILKMGKVTSVDIEVKEELFKKEDKSV